MEQEKIITFTMKSGKILKGIITIEEENFGQIMEALGKIFKNDFVGLVNACNKKSHIVLNVREIESFEVYD